MEKHIEISVTSLQSVLDCPLCFWLSERVGPAPFIVAAITRQVDSVVKSYMKQFIGSSNLPSWFPVQGTLLDTNRTFKAVHPDTGVILKGVPDALVRSHDGKYYIIDYKTGRPPEEVPDYYQMQLDGYAYLLGQNGFRPVDGGVLLYFTPDHGKISDKLFPFKITAVRAEVNPSRIPSVLARAKEIIGMETPPPRGEDCDMCMWLEQVGKTLSE